MLRQAETGAIHRLSDDLLRVTAPNASAMTAEGTNSYVLGRARLVLIDPGPDDAAHLARLIEALAGRPLDAILLTHAHRDHSGLVPALAQATGAPVLAFGDASAGRSARMRALFPGEDAMARGADTGFRPDRILRDGEEILIADQQLVAVHTPGHMGGHLCFARGELLFTGDHVMDWSSTVVLPPDGDMGDHMRSLERLVEGSWTTGLPGHGAAVRDLPTRARALYRHRRAREAQILAALRPAPRPISEIAEAAYPGLPAAMRPLAEASCLAHLIDLDDRGLITATDLPGPEARFSAKP